MKKLSVLIFMIFFLASCSSDGNSSSSSDSQITGYELRSKSVFEDVGTPTYETVTIGNLQLFIEAHGGECFQKRLKVLSEI